MHVLSLFYLLRGLGEESAAAAGARRLRSRSHHFELPAQGLTTSSLGMPSKFPNLSTIKPLISDIRSNSDARSLFESSVVQKRNQDSKLKSVMVGNDFHEEIRVCGDPVPANSLEPFEKTR